MVVSVVSHFQLVIQREKLFFVGVNRRHLFRFSQVSVKELALFVDSGLTLNGVDLMILAAQEITSRYNGGAGNL